MRAWLQGLLIPRRKLLAALWACEDRLETLESRRDSDRREFKELRGYVYALRKGKAALQEPAGDTNGEGAAPVPLAPHPRAVIPTAGLARRFKLGG